MKHQLALCITLIAGPAFADDWSFLYQTDGLKVFERKSAELQCYKAEGTIEGNLFEVMAVIADLTRRGEWVRNLEFSRVIEGDISSTVVLHEKYSFPWPASDRDTVTRSVTAVDYKNLEIQASFHSSSHPDFPPKAETVRIPKIEGHQLFRHAGPTSTFNSNTLCIDIGGDIPAWMVRLVSRDMPVDTLKDLQDQVRKTRGDYREFIRHHKALAGQKD